MAEVKVFLVTGEIAKPNMRTAFKKEIRALTPENAKETVYAELGSKHRAKRFHIRILKVEEVPPESIQNPLIRKLTLGEEPDVE